MGERGILDLIISRLPGLSLREKSVLCGSFAAQNDLLGAAKEDIEKIIGRRISGKWNMQQAGELAQKDAGTARLRGINWVSRYDDLYPPLLKEIYDPPPVLFFKGNLPDPSRPLAAIVGTRKPSPAAMQQAFVLARDLARGGISVVSGLALGIDAMAHRGNIEGGIATFAVLGSSVDEVYPAANRQLAGRVLDCGGALISEYPPGTSPRKWTFPARNRIISGISRGTLIIEAPQKSGALITAGFALEHNRDVWVASEGVADGAPARIDRRGTQRLAEEGAQVVYSACGILKTWGMETAVLEKAGFHAEPETSRDAVLSKASSLAGSLGIKL